MLFIDAVAFAMQDNTWASLEHYDQSVIDDKKKLFACCHLCPDDDSTIESLEDLLSSCGTSAAPAVLGGVGKGTSSPKGKDSYYPRGPHTDQVEGESGAAQVRKRSREVSPHAPSKHPMVSDVCMWAQGDTKYDYVEYILELCTGFHNMLSRFQCLINAS